MSIDKSSPIPVYYQLKEEIREKISNSFWKVGECINSERELSEEYGVSRMTVRQALGDLVQEGLLVREKGKGTFVCEPKVKQRDMMSFSEVANKLGFKHSTEVIEFKKMKTPIEFSDIIMFEEIYKIVRLRLIDEVIVAVETVYIPTDYCGFINEDLLKGSLYQLLASYGYEIERSESEIQAILIDDYYKKLFRVDGQIPLLKLSSNNITKDNKLLFVEESIYRSDKYTLEVNILTREGKIR
ncbi:GntR family transcriptional regulator [Clostridium oryzae]|uniref:HTH-type transcriptional repressor YvoA n=1 Tax=Clostridium oryzae TaxID=1450648 RepID=A0A1V4IXG3_9CLOT|nr:GntR family transcriptional regulator [Clostridium oryzae]OPJ64583.1 HTH-type transcriptional repressor YvoA [Clostridium oryzae]